MSDYLYILDQHFDYELFQNAIVALLLFSHIDTITTYTELPISSQTYNSLVISKKDNNKHCVICFEEYKTIPDRNISELDCSHIFHTDCLKTWLNKNRSCPLCRQEVD
jgi:hypothetical protein